MFVIWSLPPFFSDENEIDFQQPEVLKCWSMEFLLNEFHVELQVVFPFSNEKRDMSALWLNFFCLLFWFLSLRLQRAVSNRHCGQWVGRLVGCKLSVSSKIWYCTLFMNYICLSFGVWVYVSQINLQELFSGGVPSDSGMREVVAGGAVGGRL